MARYGKFAYKPDINARVAGSDARLAREAAAKVASREQRRREHFADDHLKTGAHQSAVDDCPLCQQERKEDAIIARHIVRDI